MTLTAAFLVLAALFVEPLHLTRTIDDPIGGGTTTVEEYYHASRVVSVSGERTVIVDYASNQVTEIDRASGTYSITPFATFAKYAKQGDAAIRNVEVNVDCSVTLSKETLEIVAGIAYPNARSKQADAVMSAARTPTAGRMQATSDAASETYALPVEQNLTFEVEGREMVMHNRVTRIGHEMPPAAALLIPPGAKQVESKRIRLQRELEELDRLPR